MRKATDQNLIDAALKFVILRTAKMEAFRVRNNLIKDLREHELCEGDFSDPTCHEAFAHGVDPSEYCEPCRLVNAKCVEYQQANDKASGALRALMNVGKRYQLSYRGLNE